MNALQRVVESWRYNLRNLEFWISPDGNLREWIRHVARLAILIGVPSFIVLPIITFALGQLVGWTRTLTSILEMLIVLPILALVAIPLVFVTWLTLRGILFPRR